METMNFTGPSHQYVPLFHSRFFFPTIFYKKDANQPTPNVQVFAVRKNQETEKRTPEPPVSVPWFSCLYSYSNSLYRVYRMMANCVHPTCCRGTLHLQLTQLQF